MEVNGGPDGERSELLFTDNETNARRLYGLESGAHVKNAFHEYVIRRRSEALNPDGVGTKVAAHYRLTVPAGGERVVRLRLFSTEEEPADPFSPAFDGVFDRRIEEADAFYAGRLPEGASEEERNVLRQGYAGLLWSKSARI